MKLNAVLKSVGALGGSWTSIGMRTHHPMQIDTPLQMMNSAVHATIQSAVEKRRMSPAKDAGSWVPFTTPLVYARSLSIPLLRSNRRR
jgi:hypothetical protein